MQKKYLKIIFLSVAAFLSLIAFILFAAPFLTLKAGFLESNASGFNLAFDFGSFSSQGKYIPDGGSVFGVLISFALTLGALGGAIAALITAIMIATGKMKRKQQTADQQTTQMIISIVCAVILGFVPLILNILTPQTTGYGNNPYASAGVGGIISGILVLLAEGLIAATNFIKE